MISDCLLCSFHSLCLSFFFFFSFFLSGCRHLGEGVETQYLHWDWALASGLLIWLGLGGFARAEKEGNISTGGLTF